MKKLLIIIFTFITIKLTNNLLGMNYFNIFHTIRTLACCCFTADLEERFLHAARTGNIQEIQYALEHGIPINTVSEWNTTALHYAAIDGFQVVVEHLVQAGANINHWDDLGQTPLHEAARNNHITIVQYLVEQGAKINQRDSSGFTPYDLALANNHIVVATYLKNVESYLEKCIRAIATTSDNDVTIPNYALLTISQRMFLKEHWSCLSIEKIENTKMEIKAIQNNNSSKTYLYRSCLLAQKKLNHLYMLAHLNQQKKRLNFNDIIILE
jgi:ankyrin repeat protein